MQNNTWFTIQLTEFQVVIDLTREIFLPILLSQFPYQQHSPQYIHRTSRKKPLKFQSIVFLNSPIVTFLKTGKISYSDTLVKVHIYLSVYLCIYLFIYLSTYLYLDMICILLYLSIYLCICISIYIHASISVSIILSLSRIISLYNHNKIILISD